MPAMKVLYLAPTARMPDRLTAYTFLDEELRAFSSAGVDVHLLSTSAEGSYTDDGLHVHAVSERGNWRGRVRTLAFIGRRPHLLNRTMLHHPRETGYYLRFERIAAELIRAHGIDLIHSMFGWPGGFGGAVARDATGVPLIANFRGMDLLRDAAIGYGMRMEALSDTAIRMLLRRADRTLYVSSFMRDCGIRLGAPADRAICIPKGVNTGIFSPVAARASLRQSLGFETPIILSVCGLISRKGVDTIIEAIANLDNVPAHTLVICGDGPERSSLERLARERGVSDRVRFMGYVKRSDIPRFFAAADISVLASVLEAAGNVVLEAMSCGRPVVCTDSGGPPEYVRHGVTGFVVPVGDAHAMGERLGELLRDPAMADAMGRRGRETIMREHRYERMVADVLGLYEETAAQRRSNQQSTNAGSGTAGG
jgi:glycosyltransferase involved in cell wall biosynthesis